MTSSDERLRAADPLRAAVFAELKRQKSQPQPEATEDRARTLGTFVEVSLDNQGISRKGFARMLDIERELADAILDGNFPLSEIDDEFLAQIAQVIQHPPNILRVMAGRSITPTLKEAPAGTVPATQSGQEQSQDRQ
jgi:plasmid maintenance system antidote protein VapI